MEDGICKFLDCEGIKLSNAKELEDKVTDLNR